MSGVRGADAFVRGGPSGARTGRARVLGPLLAVTLLAIVAVLTAAPPDTEIPFDPNSAGRQGLGALVAVLEELDVEVEVTSSVEVAAQADSVLVPPLGWGPADVDALLAAGARVVTSLPPDELATSSLLGVGGVGRVELDVDCPLLPDVERLAAVSWRGWVRTTDLPSDDAAFCLERENIAWLVRVERGGGELLSLGTMQPLQNLRFVDTDAAIAAVRLLVPTGTERVAVLDRPTGERPPTLVDLIDRRWFDAAWLTLLVLVLLALAYGRRLGRPVSEQLPVRVPSGELARAIGDLRHRAGHDERAAESLRQRTLTLARRRLGLPVTAGVDEVLDALETAGRLVGPKAAAALRGQLVEDLPTTAAALAELRADLRLDAPRRRPDA